MRLRLSARRKNKTATVVTKPAAASNNRPMRNDFLIPAAMGSAEAMETLFCAGAGTLAAGVGLATGTTALVGSSGLATVATTGSTGAGTTAGAVGLAGGFDAGTTATGGGAAGATGGAAGGGFVGTAGAT